MLKLEQISFAWPGRQVLENISFELHRGEILALLGPNGAGKSTLLRTILGQLTPAAGEIYLEDKALSRADADRSRIAWVPQAISIYQRLTVAENLEVFAAVMNVPPHEVPKAVDRTLALIGLEGRRGDLAGDLSGGMQRMLNVGIALVARPELLILDEPTAGIDQRAREQLHKTLLTLKEEGLAILVTTHDLDDAKRLADRLAILVEGKMCAVGSVTALISEHFGGQREVRVQSTKAEPDREVTSLLQRYGLKHQAGCWSGLLSQTDGELEKFLGEIFSLADSTLDVTVREPGLDMLLRRYLVDRRTV